MCDLGLTAMAMSVASQAASVAGQRQQAKAQEAAQKQASAREMRRFQLSQRAERQKQADEETAASLEAVKANRETAESISSTIVSAEESGVAGTSVGLAIDEFSRKNAEYQAAMAMQERMNATAQRLSFENAGNQYVNRMTQINKPIQKPNYLGAALSIGQTIAGGMSQYKQGQQLDALNNKQSTLLDLQIKNAGAGVAASQQAYSNALGSFSSAQQATQIQRARTAIESTNLYNQGN